MFAADRASKLERLFVQVSGQVLHPSNIGRFCQIQKRANVQLTVARMGEKGRRDLPVFQHILDPQQELRQNVRRNRYVFNKG